MKHKNRLVKWLSALCLASIALISCFTMVITSFTRVNAEGHDNYASIDLSWNSPGYYGYITAPELLDMSKEGQSMSIEWTTVGSWSGGSFNPITALTWEGSSNIAGRLVNDANAATGNLGNGKLGAADAIGNGYDTKFEMTNVFENGSLSKVLVSAYIRPTGTTSWYDRNVYDITSKLDYTTKKVAFGLQMFTGTVYNFNNLSVKVNGEAVAMKLSSNVANWSAHIADYKLLNDPTADIFKTIDLSWNTPSYNGYITAPELLDMSKEGQSMSIEWTTVGTFTGGSFNPITALTWEGSSNIAGRLVNDANAATGNLGNGKLGTADAIGNGYDTKFEMTNVFENGSLSKVLVSAYIRPTGTTSWYDRKVYDITSKLDYTTKKVAFGLQMFTTTVYNLDNLSVKVNGKLVTPKLSSNVTDWSEHIRYSNFEGVKPAVEGASIRLTPYEDARGLRFKSTYDRALMDALLAQENNGIIADVTFGTLITAHDLLTTNSVDFTMEAMDANDILYLDVEASGFYAPETTDKEYVTYASIVKIKDYNYARDFAARAYVKVEYKNGEYDIYYADFSATDDVRSASMVAEYFIGLRSNVETDYYQYYIEADGNWSPFDEDDLKILKGYIVEGN